MVRRCITAFILAQACYLASFAAEQNAPATPDQAGPGEVEMNEMIRSESQQPMNMNEPMPTAMARKGMKIGDMKANAMKKEVIMDEKMKQEEMKH
jgi:hypothetical protein